MTARRVFLSICYAACAVAVVGYLLPPSLFAQTVVNGGGGVGGGGGGSVSFPLLAPDGTACTAPSYAFASAAGTGWVRSGTTLRGCQAGANVVEFNASFLFISGGLDFGLGRVTTGVGKAVNGSTGDGWIQNTAGDQFLTANATNDTVTPANLTDLTVSVTSGRKYVFRMVAQIDNSTDADGIRFDFDGGAATATDFRVTCKSFNNNLTTAVSQTTALATDITEASYVGAGTFECAGSFEPSSTSTFIPRFAMNADTGGTLTVFRGSHLMFNDMP